MHRTLLIIAGALALSACANRLPEPASISGPMHGCRLPVVKLSGNQFDDPDEGAGVLAVKTLIDTVREPQRSEKRNKRKAVLVLSGGSLHGAFGAGLFYGWQKATQSGGEGIPNYDIITGVSTGALQSTFIFLASSDDDAVKRLSQKQSEIVRLKGIKFLAHRFETTTNGVDQPGSSYLANLAQDYMPDRESDLLTLHGLQNLSPNKLGMLELVGRSSVADMGPLRQIIDAEIGPETLAGVAVEGRKGRKLYVAMADLANGYGYAADLTMLAQVATASRDEIAHDTKLESDVRRVFVDWDPSDRRNRVDMARRCYVDALVASSTVPPGVPPVSIEFIKEGTDGHILNPNHSNRVAAQHPFIDGGATFAVFFTQLPNEVPDLENVDMDLIVNGSYYPQQWENFSEKDGSIFRKIRDAKVSSIDLVLRSADILQTQVRILSVQEARRWAQGAGQGRFRWAFIDNHEVSPGSDGIDRLRKWRGDVGVKPERWPYTSGGQSQSCSEWHGTDSHDFHPMEFYPTYMRCMVNYGMRRGVDPNHRWNLCVSNDRTKCASEDADRQRPVANGGR